ncbi:hypothetical protein PR202_gb28957 [Eleusine coracana subsp. coracana]|uniref:Uncharacterized protein n=1 Tax=Eleusine coracana subsp. coracana TaxID=191504 RepID=A0AAV5FYB5_ELECO|nr:hypothetical protein PR202_gb28957 [Eleusine coracana subsp. coracana]
MAARLRWALPAYGAGGCEDGPMKPTRSSADAGLAAWLAEVVDGCRSSVEGSTSNNHLPKWHLISICVVVEIDTSNSISPDDKTAPCQEPVDGVGKERRAQGPHGGVHRRGAEALGDPDDVPEPPDVLGAAEVLKRVEDEFGFDHRCGSLTIPCASEGDFADIVGRTAVHHHH